MCLCFTTDPLTKTLNNDKITLKDTHKLWDISLINQVHFKNISIIRICTSLFQNHLQSTIKSAFMSSFCTLSTCSQGLSISQLLSLLWWSSELSVFCLLGQEATRLVELKDAPLSLGSTPTDLHFHVCSLPPVRVFWIVCGEFFKGLSSGL